MKKFLVAACAGMLSISGAMAQNSMSGPAESSIPITNPNGLLPDFDLDGITPVLDELGVGWQAYEGGEGGSYLLVDSGGGMRFILEPRACRDGGGHCTGLKIYTMLQGYADPAAVADFNLYSLFSKTMRSPGDGQAIIARYEIAEFGISRGNLYVVLAVFNQDAINFANALATAAQTVSYEGAPAANMATDRLNRMAGAELTGLALLGDGVTVDHHKLNAAFNVDLLDGADGGDTKLRRKLKNLTGE